MKFYKYISIILHPIVIPTIGILLYFLLIPNNLGSKQELGLLVLIFVTTYLIPLFILILFKKIKLIKSFNVSSIKERKIPVAMMIVLFYLLGNTLYNVSNLRDIGLLFYATTIGLVFIYILFSFQFKTSIHLLSLGIFTGFFIVLGITYSQNYILLIIIAVLLSGVLATARLNLKAHNSKEIYFGYFLGFISPFLVFYLL